MLGADEFRLDCTDRSDGGISMSHIADLPGGELRVSARIADQDREKLSSLSLRASGDVTVRQVRFPVLQAEVNPFDSLLMAAPWGDNIQRPVRTIRQYCAGKGSSWIYDYVKCGEDEVIYTYPSILSMQYMTLHNPSASLYVGCYDEGDSTKTFHAKVLGESELGLWISHYPYLHNGTWESPQCGIARLPGGWHAAADLYASHMRSRFLPPDSPKWMRGDETGWNGFVQVMMRREGQPPILRYGDLPDVYRRICETGMETLHVAGWNYDGFDTRYPDYDADPLLGTAEELACAIGEIHSMGGRVILYTNGRLVDPASAFYRSGGSRCVCLDECGQPYAERYNTSVSFQIACPACPEYGEYLAGQVGKIASYFGADAVQIDQISCNVAYFCHDGAHPHGTPADNYLPGVSAELQAVRSAHREVNPEFFTWCEGCHERFGQHYDVNQGHGEEHTWQLGESIPEQFLYTYPDRWVTGISGNIQQLCHTFAQGKPFDLPLSALEDEGYVALLKRFVKLRRAYPEYFYRGTFIDSSGITVSEGIRACGIRGEGGGLLVNLWKPGAGAKKQCSGILLVSVSSAECLQIHPDADNIHIAKDGEVYRISWSGPVAVLLFMQKA